MMISHTKVLEVIFHFTLAGTILDSAQCGIGGVSGPLNQRFFRPAGVAGSNALSRDFNVLCDDLPGEDHSLYRMCVAAYAVKAVQQNDGTTRYFRESVSSDDVSN